MSAPTTRPRFMVHVSDDDRVMIYDDEFHWDALLKISGDFESKEVEVGFAQAIVDLLNASFVPSRPEHLPSTSLAQEGAK